MPYYRQKNKIVYAIQFINLSPDDLVAFCPDNYKRLYLTTSFVICYGDWIVRNDDGTFSIIEDKDFQKLYEKV